MAYWLYVTNSHNWGVTKKTNILGASKRYTNALSRLNKGDKCLVYVISERYNGETVGAHAVAEYEVASQVFEDDSEIFQARTAKGSERFPLRVKLKPLRIFTNPIPLKQLVNALSFIKNKKNWALHIRGKAIVEISKHDYEIITERAS